MRFTLSSYLTIAFSIALLTFLLNGMHMYESPLMFRGQNRVTEVVITSGIKAVSYGLIWPLMLPSIIVEYLCYRDVSQHVIPASYMFYDPDPVVYT